MSVVFETQKSLYAKLTADSTLMGLVSGIFDYVQEGTEFPYVAIGDISGRDESALGQKRYELDVNIEVYTQGLGNKQGLEIVSRLQTLLDNQALTITGFTHVSTRLIAISSNRNSDNSVSASTLALKISVKQ